MGNNISDTQLPPVITVDGPGGTGKGTVSKLVAKKLDWHYLDSGLMFRVLAYEALQQHLDLEDEQGLVALSNSLDAQFVEDETDGLRVILSGKDVTHAVRTEASGNAASKIGTLRGVRAVVLEQWRALRQWPGLVTDGRDMGTVAFPDACLKIFLLASPEERANRRYKQLKKKGIHVSLEEILQEIAQRDKRDQERTIAPLKPASDAVLIDTTQMSVEQVFMSVMEHVYRIFPEKRGL